MSRIVALTAVGLDQPGIVAGVAKVFYDLGCNLEESSMNILRKDFAMIMLIAVPKNISIKNLSEKIQPVMDNFSLSLNLRELSKEEMQTPAPDTTPNYVLSIYGTDKPGIVFEVSKYLASEKINITDLQTQITHNKQQPLYAIILEIDVPEQTEESLLNDRLKDLCANLKVDFSLEPIYHCENM